MISPQDRRLRRRQALGLVWIALAILAFATYRVGWHAIFLSGWWRAW